MIAFTLNGAPAEVPDDAATPLLDVLRNRLGLTGARFGCGLEQCGACMVLVDGAPAYACTRELGSLAGRAVTTIEGVQDHAVIAALIAEQAGQCGYCLSGIAMSAVGLFAHNAHPSRDEIVAALEPHLCRCGAQPRMLRAMERVAGR
jgi:nicotinate dehydrogenase subunit A